MKPLFLLAICGLLLSCESKPSGDNATVTEEKSASSGIGTTMYIDTAASSVSFTGWGVGKSHPGKFKFNEGTFIISDDRITAGKFKIDINSIRLDQPEDIFQTKLRDHLLSPDFFEVQTFPYASFEITGTEPYTDAGSDTSVIENANTKVSGNLTLKGVTKNVTFPARVDLTDNSLSAKANFDIDRTQWNMRYGSDKEQAKDKFISPEVNIKLNIRGRTSH